VAHLKVLVLEGEAEVAQLKGELAARELKSEEARAAAAEAKEAAGAALHRVEEEEAKVVEARAGTERLRAAVKS
jgi:hypothetical protein